MKYFKILVVALVLTFSVEFSHAKSMTLTVEPTFLQVKTPPPPPPRPPLPFSRHHRRHHRGGIHIRLPKPPPHPPGPPGLPPPPPRP